MQLLRVGPGIVKQCSYYPMGWATEEMFNWQGQEIFFLLQTSPALGPTQSSILWVGRLFFQAVSQLECEPDHSHLALWLRVSGTISPLPLTTS